MQDVLRHRVRHLDRGDEFGRNGIAGGAVEVGGHSVLGEGEGIEPLRLIAVPQVSGLVAGHSAAPSIKQLAPGAIVRPSVPLFPAWGGASRGWSRFRAAQIATCCPYRYYLYIHHGDLTCFFKVSLPASYFLRRWNAR